MTQVDFYILGGRYAAQPLQFVCRLVDKVYHQGRRVYLHVPEGMAAPLDDLLWSFNQESFIPHARAVGSEDDPDTPIHIGSGPPPRGHHDVLVNLTAEVPDWFSRFTRTVELVSGDEEQKQLARRRYKFYKDRGYPLTDHKI